MGEKEGSKGLPGQNFSKCLLSLFFRHGVHRGRARCVVVTTGCSERAVVARRAPTVNGSGTVGVVRSPISLPFILMVSSIGTTVGGVS